MEFITPLIRPVNKAAAVHVTVEIIQKEAFIHTAPLPIQHDTNKDNVNHQTVLHGHVVA